MGSKTLHLRAKRRVSYPTRSNDFILSRDPERETFLLYSFDEAYFDKYAEFYDAVKATLLRYEIPNEMVMCLEHTLSPSAMVDVLMREQMGSTDMTEAMMDDIYGLTDIDDCASDIIEHVVNFCNCGVFPHGFDNVCDLLRTNEGFYLLDFYPVREEDTMVYVVANADSE